MNHTATTGALHNGGVSRWITTYRYLCLQPARSATAKMDSTILPVIGGIHSGAAPPLFLMLVGYFSSSSMAGKLSRAVPASVSDQRIVRPAFTPSTSPSPCSSLSLSRRVGAVTPSASCNSLEVGATGARKICTCPSRYSSRRTSSSFFEVSPGCHPSRCGCPPAQRYACQEHATHGRVTPVRLPGAPEPAQSAPEKHAENRSPHRS